jgi:hypothetical protein
LINALSAIKEKERERGEQQKQEREKERERPMKRSDILKVFNNLMPRVLIIIGFLFINIFEQKLYF